MIMPYYKQYINQTLPGRLLSDLNRIKNILRYNDKSVLYREDKYFVEFIFEDYDFDRRIFFYLHRIYSRVLSNIRFGKTNKNKLLFVIEKYPEIFVD